MLHNIRYTTVVLNKQNHMPPKVQYTKEIIIKAAIEMIREKGFDSINARDLGAKIGCSSRPLFTAFKNMEELIETARFEATEEFIKQTTTNKEPETEDEKEMENLGFRSKTKYFGKNIVKYAKREPNLFIFIHWKGAVTPNLIQLRNIMKESYKKELDLTENEAEILYDQMSIFSLGLCSMITNRVRNFTDEEINDLLTRQFISNITFIKTKRK